MIWAMVHIEQFMKNDKEYIAIGEDGIFLSI